MRRTKNGVHWLIEGYDGGNKIYERRVDAGQLTENQARALIQALVAKAGLTFDEIVGAYAKKRTRIANVHLDVHRDGPYPVFWCGNNPHFVISARRPDGSIVGKPK
jgi:hypothetical protein